MRTRFAIVVACVGSAASAQEGGGREWPGRMELSGRVIARPVQVSTLRERGLDAAAIHEARERARAAMAAYREEWREPLVDHYVLALPAGESEQEAVAGLMATGLFEFVEPDWIVYPIDCPDDPQFGAQWHHDADHMDSCAGWEMHPGGPLVSVGVCDAGVQTTHPDLQRNRLEGYNARSRLWESEGGQVGAVHPHGTQTTGCAAANGDNRTGVCGMGWNLGHRMLRVADDHTGSTTLSILTHAALTSIEAGDRVANVSYSGVNAAAVRSTATQIKSMGGLLVWAAGNNGGYLDWGDRDADDVICVGATDEADSIAWFSAYGPSVDVVAPGQGVLTTTTGGSYTRVDGTSFSAPLVSGLIALIWSHNPGLSPDEVEQALKRGCDDLGVAGPDATYGYGRIDVAGALAMAGHPPVEFAYPDGLPDKVDPRGGTTAAVVITLHDATLDGPPLLWFDDGSGYRSAELRPGENDEYRIVFPEMECGASVAYYLAATTSDGQTIRSPHDAPGSTWDALAVVDVIERSLDEFESDSGWTVGASDDTAVTGVWTRMNPAGTAAQPENDVTFRGVACWVTDGRGGPLGDYDVDGGKTTLTSPELDLSAYGDPIISYWRWYSNDTGADPRNDTFRVDISVAGGAWMNAETVGPGGDQASGGWRYHEFRVADVDRQRGPMRVRFVAEDAGEGSLVEAAIDDFRVSEYDCGLCAGDFNADGGVSTLDVIAFLKAWAARDGSADTNGDGRVDARDAIGFLNVWNAGC